jgi:hypothetical protein
LIAYSIEKHLSLEKTGRAPWSWLFIIEGVLAIGVSSSWSHLMLAISTDHRLAIVAAKHVADIF